MKDGSHKPLLSAGWTLAGGVAALALGMGIGRFSYTLVLPSMLSVAGFGTTSAANVAAWNYAGYLAGAILASYAPLRRHRLTLVLGALAMNILTSALMSVSTAIWFWSVVRFASGVSSAFIFIFVSAIVLDRAPERARSTWAGVLYSGVGLGILASALYIGVFPADTSNFRVAWLCMAALSVAIFIISLLGLRSDVTTTATPAGAVVPTNRRQLNIISAAFFFEAVGYVIPATFIVHFVSESAILHAHAREVWALVGASAAPSALIWGRASRERSALLFAASALILQGIGIAVDLVSPTVIGAILLAVTLGFTFVAITALIIRAACEISPEATSNVVARVTIAFGMGQVVGPPLAAFARGHLHGFNGALLVALLSVVAALLFLSLSPRQISRTSIHQVDLLGHR